MLVQLREITPYYIHFKKKRRGKLDKNNAFFIFLLFCSVSFVIPIVLTLLLAINFRYIL